MPFIVISQGDNDKIFYEADQLFAQRNYYEASISYERILFQNSPQTEIICKAVLGKVQCYKQISDFEGALHELQRINIYKIPDSFKSEFFYEIALCSYLTNNYESALYHLKEIDFRNNAELENFSNLLYVMTYNQLQQWDSAKLCAIKYINGTYVTNNHIALLTETILELYSKESLPKLKNEKLARNMSMFCPGLGQCYSGYPLDGLLNLSLCTASFLLSVYFVQNGLFLTGAIGGLGLFIKFYFGGVNRAIYLSKKKNTERKRKFIKKINKILLQDY
nr:hypothetical protein [Bacteroidota bacterium]